MSDYMLRMLHREERRLPTEEATVSRLVRTSDGSGGWTEQEQPHGTIEGRLQPLTVEQQIVARQSGARISHTFDVDADTDVRRGDVLALRDMTAVVRSVRRPTVPGFRMWVDLEERQV